MSKNKGFPDGWEIVGLYREGRGLREVEHGDVRSRDVARSDAIVVRYTKDDDTPPVYRTIHGAVNKTQVGDLIDRVVQVVSPA